MTMPWYYQRLADTFIGCALAVLAVIYILPDWQSKRLHKVMADALDSNKELSGSDHWPVSCRQKSALNCISRRSAHNNDANLTVAISGMLVEPDQYQAIRGVGFRFCCSIMLYSAISRWGLTEHVLMMRRHTN